MDSEIEITKVVPAGEPNNNNPTEINTKQEAVSEIQITKVMSANEQNNNSPTEIDIKEQNILGYYTSDTRTLSETKPDVSRRVSGKIYISEHYWEEENPMFANNLPYDIDDKYIYVLPINKSKRFESAKDGRPWTNIKESKISNFSGDRYMNTCAGLYECHNRQCPHLMQHKKINRRQFTQKVVCKSCATLSSRSLYEARKIWEFSEDSNTVIIKHFGLQSCSPIKPKRERELTKEIVGNPQKSSAV